MIVAEVSKSPARDEAGNTLYFIISERDITEERSLTAQLSHQALHDPLTGLANRALLRRPSRPGPFAHRCARAATARSCCSTSTTSRA